MFLAIIRFLLLWWIISVLFKWVVRLGSSINRFNVNEKKKSDPESTMPFTGEIEDADFEEIDENE